MAKLSDLPDELLVKILSFLPTKDAVSTSILSKQWQFLWMWLPNLAFDSVNGSVRDFINKNLPLHRAPIINSLCLSNLCRSLVADNFTSWIEIAVSRRVRELSISNFYAVSFVLPSSLYTCNSLVTLKLDGTWILVDVPRTVSLPSLKTLHLSWVRYSNEDSLRLLLCYCPVLEDLSIEQEQAAEDNAGALVIKIPSLQRLSLVIDEWCSSDEYVIVTPSLKYLYIQDDRDYSSYSIEHMPELEEAYIHLLIADSMEIEKLLKSITTVKRLTIHITNNRGSENPYRHGVIFSQLANLRLYICSANWSEILFQLLNDSPNLQNLYLQVYNYAQFEEYKPVSWSNDQSSFPKCLMKSLQTFKFKGYDGEEEQRDFLSFIFKHARCLKSTTILP